MRFRIGGAVVELGRGQLVNTILFAVLVGLVLFFLSSQFILRHNRTSSDNNNSDNNLELATPIALFLPAAAEDPDDVREIEEYDDAAGPRTIPSRRRAPGRTRTQADKKPPPEETVKGADGNSAAAARLGRTVEMAMRSANKKKRPAFAEALKRVVGADNRPPDAHYNINVTLSDATSLDRPLPETRPPVCLNMTYDVDLLPKVSVIIPFFNEAPTMILRTVHSVLNRSPDQLIEEIILVDDLSYDAPLKTPLERYVRLLPKVQIIRRTKRSGLIVSRMDGARVAKAPVIIFLDAHSEVGEGWLEPMLEELRLNPKQVIQPFVDGIDSKTLEFSAPGTYYKGAFSWDLRYTWLRLAPHEEERAKQLGQPFVSPTLVGCAIAVMKDYFFEMGSFDEGLYVWGGENLELAFRVWMCGGKTMTVTCSRVGHVFKQSPNKFDGTIGTKEQTVQKNLIRVADVWLDRYRKYFYATTLPYDFKRLRLNEAERASLVERSRMRETLKCHNFDWYLYNVIPEMMDVPPMDSRYFGEIMSLHTRACWEVTEDYYVGMTYFCFEHKVIPKNNFALTTDGLLRYRDKCVQIVPPKPYMLLAECPKRPADIERFGVWELQPQGVVWGTLKVKLKNADGVFVYWCIVQVTNAMPEHSGEQMPQLGNCDGKDLFQIWAFTYAVDFSLEAQFAQA